MLCMGMTGTGLRKRLFVRGLGETAKSILGRTYMGNNRVKLENFSQVVKAGNVVLVKEGDRHKQKDFRMLANRQEYVLVDVDLRMPEEFQQRIRKLVEKIVTPDMAEAL